MYGPPDRVVNQAMHWLIVPGPPVSCYFIMFFPMPATDRLDYYHVHPKTWSIHIVVAGAGFYYADGIRHAIGPGSVMYHGPGVPHCGPFPDPGSLLQMFVIQHPSSGHAEGEWLRAPEAGLAEQPGDVQAFVDKYGPMADLQKYVDSYPAIQYDNPSERWKTYSAGQRPTD